MTDYQIQTIILLLILATCFGMLLLFLRMHRMIKADRQWNTFYHINSQLDTRVVLHRLSESAHRERGIKQALLEDGKLTRQRISQVKTRLSDEESDDQKNKAHERYERSKGKGGQGI